MRNWIILLIVLGTSLLSACSSRIAEPTETPTPLVIPTLSPSSTPISSPVPTTLALSAQPDVALGNQALAERRFEYAITLFNKLYAAHPGSTEARNLLAGAYISWGRDSIAQAGGNLEQLANTFSQALDRLNSGLALGSATSSDYIAAVQIRNIVSRFIEQYDKLVILQQLAANNGDLAQRQEESAQLVEQLTALRNEQPDLAGITALSTEALLVAAAAYEATNATGTAATNLLEQARAYCLQAQELGDTDAAPACVTRITRRLEAVVVKPTPTKQVARQLLAVRRINSNDDPSCLSINVAGIATNGWSFSINGLRLAGRFDTAGNARICGLGARQEVTFSIISADGSLVPGGSGIPARGGDIFSAVWQP